MKPHQEDRMKVCMSVDLLLITCVYRITQLFGKVTSRYLITNIITSSRPIPAESKVFFK